MKRFNQLSLTQKLFSGIGLILLFVTVGMGYNLWTLQNMTTQYEDMIRHDVMKMKAADDLSLGMTRQAYGVRGYILVQDDERREQIERGGKEKKEALEQLLAQQGFKLPDPVAHRAGRDAQFGGRLGEAAEPGRTLESRKGVNGRKSMEAGHGSSGYRRPEGTPLALPGLKSTAGAWQCRRCSYCRPLRCASSRNSADWSSSPRP